jgi:hypothetical protein
MVFGHMLGTVVFDMIHHGAIFGIGLVAGLGCLVWAARRAK